MRCADCAMWEMDLDNKDYGICRANSPRPTIIIDNPGDEYKIVWPKLGKDDWCGQFRDRTNIQ